MICSVIAEVNRDVKKRRKPFTPSDFMPKAKPKEISSKQMLERVKMITISLGGEVK